MSGDDTFVERKSSVIYLGRIPYGFFESEMRAYFSQFGEVLRLRLSRNKKTGKSRHYAFIEFAHPEVAEIVSETHNNMLLCDRIIKCSIVPTEKASRRVATAVPSTPVRPVTTGVRAAVPSDHVVRQQQGVEAAAHQGGCAQGKFPFSPLSCREPLLLLLSRRCAREGAAHKPTRRARQEMNRKRSPAETARRVGQLVARERRKRRALEAKGVAYDFAGYEALRDGARPKRTKFADD